MQHNNREKGKKMTKLRQLVWMVTLVATFWVHPTFADKKDDCALFLEPTGGTSRSSGDLALQAFLQERPFGDILLSNPKENLVARHPFMAMNAAQRLYSIIMDAGHEVRDVFLKGAVPRYNLFSVPSEVNGNEVIIGHEDKIHDLVQKIEGAIKHRGKIPLLLGPHGTGKTMSQIILRNALTYYSLNQEQFQYWTYQFIKLDKIKAPGLHLFPEGKLMAPLLDSPIVLLPSSYQEAVIGLAGDAVRGLDVGDPRPFLKIDPISARIRNDIIRHKLAGKENVTDKDIVDALSEHVVLRRAVLGKDGMTPIIDAQGKDPDMKALFGGLNPLLHLEVEGGNPLAWNMGTVMRSNGTALFFDELYRNPPELLNQYLRLFESGEVDLGSGDPVFVDAFIIAASNSANLRDIMGDAKGHASRDRVDPINYLWSVVPHKVAKTILHMSRNAYARELPLRSSGESADGEIASARSVKEESGLLEELFPLLEESKPFLGTDGRYQLSLGDGGEEAFLNPHTLMFMANVVAATRMTFDPKAVDRVKKGSEVRRIHEFKSPIARLRFLMNELEIDSSGRRKELLDMMELLDDGEKGISARDAAEWLNATRDAALMPGNGNSITPRLAKEVFLESLREGGIEHGNDPQLRAEWEALATEVMAQIIVPRLREDVQVGLQEPEELAAIYDEILAELVALGNDSSAELFRHPLTKRETPINKKRLDKVSEIYARLSGGRTLDSKHIGMFLLNQVSSGKGSDVRHQPLEASIVEYLADIESARVPYGMLEQAANNVQISSEANGKYRSLAENLVNRKGYDQEGIKDAIAVIKEYEDLDQRKTGRIRTAQ